MNVNTVGFGCRIYIRMARSIFGYNGRSALHLHVVNVLLNAVKLGLLTNLKWTLEELQQFWALPMPFGIHLGRLITLEVPKGRLFPFKTS